MINYVELAGDVLAISILAVIIYLFVTGRIISVSSLDRIVSIIKKAINGKDG